jgi:membrane-associated phospholipid phosphatase
MSGSKTVRIVVITAVFVGIVAVFQSYVMLNVAPDPSRWAIFYAWDPSTQALVQPLSGEGAYQSFVLKSWLDAKIPFVPILSLPYVSFLIIVPFVVPALNLIAGSMRRFLTVGLALIISQLFLNVAYWLFQSNVPRTAELPDGFFGWTVGMVWGNDQPFNAFPSGHCTWAMIGILSLWRLRSRFPKTAWILMPWLALVFPATVMLQQHFLIDVYGGIFVGFATYWGVMFAVERPLLVPRGESQKSHGSTPAL